MASIQTYTFVTSDEQYEAFLQQAMEESLKIAKEEALLQKLDADSLQCALQASLESSEGDKKPLSLLARRGMPSLKFTPKIPQPGVKPSVDIIRPSSAETELRKTTRC